MDSETMWRIHVRNATVVCCIWGIAAAAAFFSLRSREHVQSLEPLRLVVKRIPDGITFSQLASSVGIATDSAAEFITQTKPVYDFATIKSGKPILFYLDRPTGELKKVAYDINTETAFSAEKVSESEVRLRYRIEKPAS